MLPSAARRLVERLSGRPSRNPGSLACRPRTGVALLFHAPPRRPRRTAECRTPGSRQAIERKLGDRFYLCTQNVDDLHERAGSHRVHHMHGTPFSVTLRSMQCCLLPDQAVYETALPSCGKCGAPVRPHIVWFGEIPLDMEGIYRELDRATHLLVVGHLRFCLSCCGICARRQPARYPHHLCGPGGTSQRRRLR